MLQQLHAQRAAAPFADCRIAGGAPVADPFAAARLKCAQQPAFW
eukprot:gene4001-6854_t